MKDRSRRQVLQGGLALASLGLLAGCGVSLGPSAQSARPRRIGWLSLGSATATSSVSNSDALRQGLGELGYVEGRNIVIEPRLAEGREERLPELAAELVGSNVDMIIAGTMPVVRAAGLATTTIPIVFVTVDAANSAKTLGLLLNFADADVPLRRPRSGSVEPGDLIGQGLHRATTNHGATGTRESVVSLLVGPPTQAVFLISESEQEPTLATDTGRVTGERLGHTAAPNRETKRELVV